MHLLNTVYSFIFCLIFFYIGAANGVEETEIGQDEVAEVFRPNKKSQTTIILFGSLGDLSTRYLWPGFHNLFLSQNKISNEGRYLRIYATGRKDTGKGSEKLSEIFDSRLCRSKANECTKEIPKFKDATSYHRTKTEEDYKTLAEEINSGISNRGLTENLRIFYLSVPPFAYSGIMNFVHRYLRPENKSTEIRIVFEKPFGQDQKSSEKLHQEIIEYFTEKEVYRVDHYLGKQTVDEIVKFRINNKEVLKSLWSDGGIESVEIVMKEENDCKGRTEFFDEYGVVLDVMQNHLTEIFARLVMDIKDNATNKDFIKAKIGALKQVFSPDIEEIIAGQYIDYNKHFQEERSSKLKGNSENVQQSRTPTFAAVKLKYNSKKWGRVPFFLISGKLLNEKSGFVKINFKSKIDYKVSETERSVQRETKKPFLIFYIYSSVHNGPGIELSPSLKEANFKFSPDWIESNPEDGVMLLKPIKNVDAYAFLIQKIYEGDKSYFIDIDSLLDTWRIWDPVQKAIKTGKVSLKKYDRNNYEKLDFTYHQNEMRTKDSVQLNKGDSQKDFQPDGMIQFSSVTENKFLGNDLVSGSVENVIKSLSSVIINSINKASNGNEIYHIVFPGGSSILPLLRSLCKQRHKFSTRFLHMWMLDERCVPLNDTKSNFKLFSDDLLSCLQLEYQNIHKMPVGHGENLCQLQAAENYAQEIKDWIPSTKFDMIILGVGQDGHIASLFPKDDKSLESSELVVINDSGPKGGIPRRMSMTLNLINSAKMISVIATGEKKKEIVKVLWENGGAEHPKLPIQMVKPINGSVVWYIDNIALGLED